MTEADELAGAGVVPAEPHDHGPDRQEALDHVRRLLRAAGATDEEIDRAAEGHVLDLLAVDRLLLPAPTRYTQAELAEKSGIPAGLLRRLWRSLGFQDTADDEPVFTDLDVEAARSFQDLLALGAADVSLAFELARVIGSSMARIAEAEVGSMRALRTEDDVAAADAFASVADVTLPTMGRLLEFVWRRQLQAAARRAMLLRERGALSGATANLVVGFADMVGFTLLSQHLTEEELADVVQRFEVVSHDIITAMGGRVIKMIGDEAMFVVPDVVAGARIAVELADAYAGDELLSDVRVGLAFGPVLLREGDVFGSTVNLASRIVNIANPGTVLVSDEMHEHLAEAAPDAFTMTPLRPRVLKDVGRVQLWWCARAGDRSEGASSASDHRRKVRFDRLADVADASCQASGLGQPGGGDPKRA
ncbi:MAG TPA: adenylate/guanylate cyclase domain-containing protein [Acidimicrobiales bacterium]|nr:adenylate/guanylate cyclase domain-containing protein [Acidimicrobiales bacterium]